MRISVKISEVTELSASILRKNGINDEDIQIVIDHLLQNELADHTAHGFYKIPGIVRAIKESGPPTPLTFERETSNSLLINAGKRLGLVTASIAVTKIIEKLNSSGLAMVGGSNYAGTTGTMGFFTRKIAEAGFIGLMMANSDPCMPAWGGSQPLLGTNPISISFPTLREPIVIDLASSARSWGDLMVDIMEGRSISEGIVIDKDGGASTDPKDAKYGLLPFGGHKGYALAVMVELLAGPLVRAKAGKKAFSGEDGFMMLGIRPDIFSSSFEFEMNASGLVEQIKTSKKLSGVDEIYYPGERSYRARMNKIGASRIDIVPQVWDQIKALAEG